MQAKHGKQQAGFSLIELMVVLIIIAILTVSAYSMYTKYSIRAHREDVKSQMIQISQHLQTYKAVNGSYTSAVITNGSIFGGTQYPRNGTALYTMGLVVANGGWVLTATPTTTAMQKGDGQIALTDDNLKCWTKGAATCTPSASTTWDGK